MISDPKLPFATDPTSVGPINAPTINAPPIDTPTTDAPAETPLPVAAKPAPRSASALRLWMHRIGVLLFVFLCATIGVMLMILPWRPEWSDNPLLLSYPALRSIMSSGFARGLATGLGVLNVWVGFWEAIQYQE
jgi:hypothetical protein